MNARGMRTPSRGERAGRTRTTRPAGTNPGDQRTRAKERDRAGGRKTRPSKAGERGQPDLPGRLRQITSKGRRPRIVGVPNRLWLCSTRPPGRFMLRSNQPLSARGRMARRWAAGRASRLYSRFFAIMSGGWRVHVGLFSSPTLSATTHDPGSLTTGRNNDSQATPSKPAPVPGATRSNVRAQCPDHSADRERPQSQLGIIEVPGGSAGS